MQQQLIEQLAAEFAELKRVLFRSVAAKIEPHLSPVQGELLFLIAREGSCSVGRVAKELRISSSAATQLIDVLIAHGLAERHQDTADRRIVHVVLSKKGNKQITRLKAHYLHGFADIVSRLPDKDIEQLHRLIKKLNSTVAKEQ